jgi:hypothetical protein
MAGRTGPATIDKPLVKRFTSVNGEAIHNGAPKS